MRRLMSESENEYVIKYPPYSLVYSIAKAKIGKLEKIAIKKYRILETKSTYNRPVVLYTDTLNFLWEEAELCAQSEAIEYATDYLTNILNEIEESE